MLTKTIAAGVIAATALTAIPANAASFNFSFGPGPSWGHGHHGRPGPVWRGHRFDRVSTHEVRRMLRQRGYRDIRFYDTRGPIYQVRAERRHRTYILVVSARDGDILSRRRA